MRRALIIFVAALGAFVQAQDSVTLTRVPKKDEEAVYQTILDVELQGQKITLFSTLNEKILAIQENGNYIVETKYSNTHRSTKDADTEFTVEPDVMTYAASGEIVAIRSKATPSLYRGANLLGLFLPDSAVKKDDVWKKQIKGNAKLGTVDLAAEFKVVGREKIGSFDCLIVNGTTKELSGKDPASTEQILWLNIADATLVKRTVTFKNLPTDKKTQPMVSAKLVVTRVEPKPAVKTEEPK
jgi:hypothetical protein